MRPSQWLGRFTFAAAAASLTFGATAVRAQTTLLVNTHPDGTWAYDGIHVGGGAWGGTTALLGTTFGNRMGTTLDLLDLNAMLGYDALWVDQRFQSAPAAAELDNLVAFAATGRRVVVIGENATWGPWNAAILGALGGGEGALQSYWGPGCQYGAANALGASVLTAGVASVNMACGGYAVGGTPLFDYNVATLWGAKQNVLTVLDANVFDDRFITPGDGERFRGNVVEWISEPVAVSRVTSPEPSTLALLGGGALVMGLAVRRRRR
jgi:hypothetical protein